MIYDHQLILEMESEIMDTNTTNIIAALGGFPGFWILFLIAYVVGDKEGSKFWLNQSLVLIVVEVFLGIIGTIIGKIATIPILGWAVGAIGGSICGVVGFFIVVLSVINIINAFNQNERALPIIGNIYLLK